MSGLTHSEQESHPMLKQRTIALVAGIAAAGMLTTAAWAGGGHRHGGMGHHRGAQMFEMMDSFDTDGDGKLTQAEIDQARKDRLAKHDADKDGKLTLQEYEALWLEAMRERMVRQFQRHDRDGDAAVTAEEFVQTTGRLAARLDRNGDGVVDREDQRRMHMHDDDDDRREDRRDERR
jgi:Ca2+-binding EF-hand superfamily protein